MCAFWTKKKNAVGQDGSEAARITSILETALDQRSNIVICFNECVTTIGNVDSYIVRLNDEEIVLCVSLVNIDPEKFAGASLKCSFRISDGKSSKHKKLYEFESSVVSVQIARSGEIHFVLAFPEKISTGQQRRCVRVSIDKKRIPLVSMWYELPEGQRISGSQPLAISNNDDSCPMRLCNLSTTGLCIKVKKSELHGKFSEIKQGDSFTFYFEAARDCGEGEQPFWVNAALRNEMHVLEGGDALFGFEFSAEGEVDENGHLKWESLRTGEVASLGAFIFKWNVLDFQKEKSCSP